MLYQFQKPQSYLETLLLLFIVTVVGIDIWFKKSIRTITIVISITVDFPIDQLRTVFS